MVKGDDSGSEGDMDGDGGARAREIETADEGG